ncbi:MAG: hypothetical protein UX77_C0014G0001 [Parcubacteria group bacterium GW2011_GWA1_47_11]|nr:MAG: hypothetical protein UX77_C0014G0001 [Parcubacteria group bacterium GW2011_GWA1_47_11]
MKKLLTRTGIVIALFLPTLAFAAYNDVTLTTDVVLSVNSVSINVSGSSATVETIAVGATTFTATLQSASTMTISAPNLSVTTEPAIGGLTAVCSSGVKTITIPAVSGANTVTVTPSSTACTNDTSSTSSGGGGPVGLVGSGGGGGGGSAASVIPAPSTPPASTPASGLSATQVDAILSLLSSFGADQATIDNVRAALNGKATTGTVTAAFARNLELGMTGADVKALQQWLNANGYRVAESGPGSLGNETTKFGGATKAALIKFQKAMGITPAAGYFGPKTRAAVK